MRWKAKCSENTIFTLTNGITEFVVEVGNDRNYICFFFKLLKPYRISNSIKVDDILLRNNDVSSVLRII